MKYSILVTSWELKGLCYIPQSLECVALPGYFSAQQPQDVQLYPDRYNAIHVFLPPSQKVLSIQCLYRKKDETQYINIKNNDIMKLRNTDYYHPTAQSRVQTMQEYSTNIL